MPGFSGQGKVSIGTAVVTNGVRVPGMLRFIGNASEFKLSIDEQTATRNDSFTGLRMPLRRISKARGASLMIKFDEFNPDNLALALKAATTQVSASGAVLGYTFPSGAKVGSVLAAPAKNLSSVVIKDSAGSPATLVPGVDYSLDAFAGTVEILRLQAFVQPFKMDYTPGAHTKTGALNQPTIEHYVHFAGINTDDNSRAIVDVFRVPLTPSKEIALINDDFADFELNGEVLADTGRAVNSADGQFFSIATA